jgi:hypothetical protein
LNLWEVVLTLLAPRVNRYRYLFVLTFCLWLRLGCTELSVLRICFNTLRLSSSPCANKSSCSAISASSTPSLSLTSLRASSLVLSPHSLSWPAMEAPSLEAFS